MQISGSMLTQSHWKWRCFSLTDPRRVLPGQHHLPGTKPLTRKMFAGLHIMNPLLLRDIPVGQESSIINPYMDALEGGANIYGYDSTGYWSDVGTPERYDQAKRDAEDGILNWISW